MHTLTDSSGQQYSWDFENRLVQAVVPGTNGGTTTFRYDPFGRRIQKSGSTGTTNYLYDADNLVEEVDQAGNVLVRYSQGLDVENSLQNYVLAQRRTIDRSPFSVTLSRRVSDDL